MTPAHCSECGKDMSSTMNDIEKAYEQGRKDERERSIAVIKDYGSRMSELQIEMIGTAHNDCKQMLAYDMSSRLIAVKHIQNALATPTEPLPVDKN